MRYYVIAGEASGDLHGANMIKALRHKDNSAEIRAWGGDRMIAEGANVVKHVRELAFMGFLEVIKNLGTIKHHITWCKQDVLEYKPDVLVLIDYPSFNLRIAKFAKKHGIKVVYYISPKVWAWKKRRVYTIKKVVDRLMVIFPFEVDFYKDYQMDVDFVGNPLVDEVVGFQSPEQNLGYDKPVIAVLPGSRKQEISMILPEMLQVAKQFQQYTFVIAGAPSQDPEFYQKFIGNSCMDIVYGKTYELLSIAKAAMVTSGTATLETALFKVPQVVCYKTSNFSYQIGKRVIKVPYISLVNLIMNQKVVTELIQDQCNPLDMSNELKPLLEGEGRERMLRDYDILIDKLGGVGASEKAAAIVYHEAQ